MVLQKEPFIAVCFNTFLFFSKLLYVEQPTVHAYGKKVKGKANIWKRVLSTVQCTVIPKDENSCQLSHWLWGLANFKTLQLNISTKTKQYVKTFEATQNWKLTKKWKLMSFICGFFLYILLYISPAMWNRKLCTKSLCLK